MRECNSFLSPICIPVSVSTHQNPNYIPEQYNTSRIITWILIMMMHEDSPYIDNNNSSQMFITLRLLFNFTIYYHRNIHLSSPIIINLFYTSPDFFLYIYITNNIIIINNSLTSYINTTTTIYVHITTPIMPLQTFTIYFKKKLNILPRHFNYF